MDLRWISLLLFALLLLRKSGQLFYDDLGGFRTFAMIDIESHFEVLTIPGVSAAPVGSADYAVLHAIFSDTRAVFEAPCMQSLLCAKDHQRAWHNPAAHDPHGVP